MIILKNPILFRQLSSSLSCSLQRLLSSTQWLLAALPHSWYCTNLWIDLHQSANLEWNLHCACGPWHIYQHWKIERREAGMVYTRIRVAHRLFQSFEWSHFHQVAQVVFRASVAPAVMKVHPCFCTSSKSVDSLLCQFGKVRSCPFDFPEPLPGVVLSLPSPCYARETQHPAASLLKLGRVVSWLVVPFRQLWRAKTFL